ncbi:MAG: S8 family serine peptidase [Chromatiales bacterium]
MSERRAGLLRAFPVRLGALLILLTTGAAQAVEYKGADPPAIKAPAASYEALLEKARTADRVRVIVRLQVPFAAEGRLARPKAVTDQRLSIARTQDSLLRRLQSHAMVSVKRFKYSPYCAMEVEAAALEALRASPEVADIIEDVAVPPLLQNSVPHIGANQAWVQGYSGTGQSVAILDTGVDRSHSFLSGKVVAEACFSTTYAFDSASSLCPNGADQQIGNGAGVNCSGVFGCEHGTHVAGIAAGRGVTFSGVARDASIISVQVFSRFDDPFFCSFLDPCLASYSSDQMQALEWVYDRRGTFAIAAVNMSLGGGGFQTHCDVDPRKPSMDNLRSVGIATVVAAGNDGFCGAISAPACISTAISVGATNDSDRVPFFSNSARILDLFAPGVGITSSVPGNAFESLSGTSMAAPHVAGTWAILKSRVPTASVDTVLSALRSTGVNVTDAACAEVTKPRIQVDAALTTFKEPTNARITSHNPDPSDTGQSVTVNFNVAATASGVGTPTGNVTVMTDGGSPTCMGALDGSGSGSCTLSFGLPGTKNLTATYAGDANFDGSNSEGVAHQVNAVPGFETSQCDFDGDLHCDILFRNKVTGANVIWTMNGATRLNNLFTTPASFNVSWAAAGVGDLDADGDPDILYRHKTTGALRIWFMDGPTRVGPSVPTTPVSFHTNWAIRGVGDFDGDGHADIVFRHKTSGAIRIWFMNGANRVGFSVPTSPASYGPNYEIGGVGDFDLDGDADIVFRNKVNGRNRIWLMDGTTTPARVGLPVILPTLASLNWVIGGAVDVDGDGDADIVLRNKISGANRIWFMEGDGTTTTFVSSQATSPAMIDPSWVIAN